MSENQITISERFSNTIISNLRSITNSVQITPEQKNLITGYFLGIDTALRENKDGLTWNDVNLQKLAVSLANKAALGLDMNIKNTLFAIPYKSKTTGLATVDLQLGYEGEKYLATKFSRYKIKEIVVELVHQNDNFEVIKKDAQHPYDNYIFEITNPFDRGKIIGGFGYISYQEPEYNKIATLSIDEIHKRRPAKAKEEFWGKWYEKMCKKTMCKEICRQVERDPEKIKEYRNFLDFQQKEEVEQYQQQANDEIQQNMESPEKIDVDVDIDTDISTESEPQNPQQQELEYNGN